MKQKELYKIELEKQLEEWEKKLLSLKAKSLKNSENNKVDLRLNDKIDNLQQNLTRGKQKLTILQHTSEESMQIFKDGAIATWELLKLRVSKTILTLKHKLSL